MCSLHCAHVFFQPFISTSTYHIYMRCIYATHSLIWLFWLYSTLQKYAQTQCNALCFRSENEKMNKNNLNIMMCCIYDNIPQAVCFSSSSSSLFFVVFFFFLFLNVEMITRMNKKKQHICYAYTSRENPKTEKVVSATPRIIINIWDRKTQSCTPHNKTSHNTQHSTQTIGQWSWMALSGWSLEYFFFFFLSYIHIKHACRISVLIVCCCIYLAVAFLNEQRKKWIYFVFKI